MRRIKFKGEAIPPPVDEILDQAKAEDLDDVLVIGIQGGLPILVLSTIPNPIETLGHLEAVKTLINPLD